MNNREKLLVVTNPNMLNNNRCDALPNESRREFLKLIGKGTAGAALLTGCTVFSSCGRIPMFFEVSSCCFSALLDGVPKPLLLLYTEKVKNS